MKILFHFNNYTYSISIDCVRNILYILDIFGRNDIRVYKGSNKPLYSDFLESEWPAYGKDGIGDISLKPHFKHPTKEVEDDFAPEAINRICKSYQNVHILTLGPLTNLSLSLNINPNLPSEIKSLTVMGGYYKRTDEVEFNVYVYD